MSAIIKPRDKVLTPTGRLAEVISLTADGKRELMYLDEVGSYVTLEPQMLRVVYCAPIKPWPTHRGP